MKPIGTDPNYTRTIQKSDINENPYIPGSENHKQWAERCNRPAPNPADAEKMCNRETNSPCDWSNTHPLYDKCAICGLNFPEWN